MEHVDLRDAFSREIEVLELNDHEMIYALDQKNEIKDLCSIERMDLDSREVTHLITLDYTRLWESFRTYGQMPGFFYAVNVLADYRLRLRKIDKKTWEITSDILIQPEGEIINIYSLNENYLIITDEVKADAQTLEAYGLKDEGRRYVNVRYLYEIYTAKKYPILDRRFDSLTEDIPVRQINGVSTVIYEAFYCGEDEESVSGGSAITAAPVNQVISQIKTDGMTGLTAIASAGEDGFDYVRCVDTADDMIVYRRRQKASGLEQLVELTPAADGTLLRQVIAEYKVPEEGEVFYDSKKRQVYWCPDGEQAATKHIRCLTKDIPEVTYDGRFGRFLGLFNEELLVTAYYDEVFVRDYEYHEYVAFHDLKAGAVVTAAGRIEHNGSRVLLLRSFLAL